MSDEKFARLIRKQLDKTPQLDADIVSRLRQQRQSILDKADTESIHNRFKSWAVPVATAAMLLIGLLVILPQGQQDMLEIATLPAEDLEIISTMDFEDLDNLDFYNWLEMQDGQAG